MKNVLDIHSRSKEDFAKRLSNLHERPFKFNERTYASMEGFLQQLKTLLPDVKAVLSALHGVPAFKAGQAYNNWKNRQKLYPADGEPIDRNSLAYQDLLDQAYDAQFDQNPAMGEDLLKTVGFELRHLMGKHDTRDTVLTEAEYIRQLNRLRWRALDEKKT